MFTMQAIIFSSLLLAASATNAVPEPDINNGRCGGSIEADSGHLTYPLPNSPKSPSGSLCIWTIHLQATSTFRLNFTNLDVVDSSQNCESAAVRIYSLTNLIPSDRSESYTFCNANPPTIGGNYFLSENLLTVIYRTSHNSSSSGSGFTLNWEGISVQPIPKSHESTYTTASSGIVRYPVEGHYPPNHVSTWLINSQPEVTEGPNPPRVQISVPYVVTDPCGRGNPEDCLCDALVLYQVTREGQLEETRRFCGNETEIGIQDVSPNFILGFFSDHEAGQGSGFEVVYKPITRPPVGNISTSCGGVVSGSSGLIEYKLNETYDKYERCLWTIRSEGRTQITLTLNQFGLENWYDVLEVMAMDASGNLTTHVFRDTHVGVPQILNATVAIISFYSDGLSSGTGFSLTYEVNAEVDSRLLYYQDEIIMQNASEASGVLRYPGSGDQVRNGELSTFVIQHAYSMNSPYEPMTLNLTAVNLERDPETGECRDRIRAFRMHSVPGNMRKFQEIRPAGGFCQLSQRPPTDPYDLVTDYVAIIFLLTDTQGRSDGFEVTWDVVFDEPTVVF